MTPSHPLPPGVQPGGRHALWEGQAPRLVVCDVDGTLVGPAAEAADEVVRAVRQVQAAGLRVGFATGRMRMAVEPLWRQLGAVGPHVLHNGAEVRADGTTVAAWTLTPGEVDALLAAIRPRDDAYLEVYTEDAYYVSSWDRRAEAHWQLLGRPPAGLLTSAGELDGAPVFKATIAVFEPAVVSDVTALVTRLGLGAGPAGSPRTPDLFYVNATHPDADKGRALLRAAEHAGIPREEVVAIGDADNDLSMLAVAGTAIAMGQAPAAVKAAAHLVVPDVDGHGVAVALSAALAWRQAA